MPVAVPHHFTPEHIETCRFNTSPVLTEQAIYCLELVSELSMSGFQFQFKGGNSLLIILDEPRRFSIDVDIATNLSREKIELCLDKIIQTFKTFKRWDKRQHKTKPWLPITSYLLYYNSHFCDGNENSIMLDCQLRLSPYKTQTKKVVCGSVYKSSAEAVVPLSSSIIGDKLLTLGPNTLGIPVGKGKEVQRLKHVYDIARLLDTFPSLQLIRESFISCLDHENDIQDCSRSIEEIINDTLMFCWSVIPFENIPEQSDLNPILKENVDGLRPFADHLFMSGYSWADLRHDIAKVAVCTSALINGSISDQQFTAVFQSLKNAASNSDLQSQLTENLLNTVKNWTGEKYPWMHK